jgi:hypothetical protein
MTQFGVPADALQVATRTLGPPPSALQTVQTVQKQNAQIIDGVIENLRASGINTEHLEQRRRPRLTIAQINSLSKNALQQGLRPFDVEDDRPAIMRFLDVVDLPRNMVANFAWGEPSAEQTLASIGGTAAVGAGIGAFGGPAGAAAGAAIGGGIALGGAVAGSLIGLTATDEERAALVAESRKGTFGAPVIYASDVMKQMGVEDPVVRGVVGFVGDVLLDPLTYLSGGGNVTTKIGRFRPLLKPDGTPVLRRATRDGKEVAEIVYDRARLTLQKPGAKMLDDWADFVVTESQRRGQLTMPAVNAGNPVERQLAQLNNLAAGTIRMGDEIIEARRLDKAIAAVETEIGKIGRGERGPLSISEMRQLRHDVSTRLVDNITEYGMAQPQNAIMSMRGEIAQDFMRQYAAKSNTQLTFPLSGFLSNVFRKQLGYKNYDIAVGRFGPQGAVSRALGKNREAFLTRAAANREELLKNIRHDIDQIVTRRGELDRGVRMSARVVDIDNLPPDIRRLFEEFGSVPAVLPDAVALAPPRLTSGEELVDLTDDLLGVEQTAAQGIRQIAGELNIPIHIVSDDTKGHAAHILGKIRDQDIEAFPYTERIGSTEAGEFVLLGRRPISTNEFIGRVRDDLIDSVATEAVAIVGRRDVNNKSDALLRAGGNDTIFTTVELWVRRTRKELDEQASAIVRENAPRATAAADARLGAFREGIGYLEGEAFKRVAPVPGRRIGEASIPIQHLNPEQRKYLQDRDFHMRTGEGFGVIDDRVDLPGLDRLNREIANTLLEGREAAALQAGNDLRRALADLGEGVHDFELAEEAMRASAAHGDQTYQRALDAIEAAEKEVQRLGDQVRLLQGTPLEPFMARAMEVVGFANRGQVITGINGPAGIMRRLWLRHGEYMQLTDRLAQAEGEHLTQFEAMRRMRKSIASRFLELDYANQYRTSPRNSAAGIAVVQDLSTRADRRLNAARVYRNNKALGIENISAEIPVEIPPLFARDAQHIFGDSTRPDPVGLRRLSKADFEDDDVGGTLFDVAKDPQDFDVKTIQEGPNLPKGVERLKVKISGPGKEGGAVERGGREASKAIQGGKDIAKLTPEGKEAVAQGSLVGSVSAVPAQQSIDVTFADDIDRMLFIAGGDATRTKPEAFNRQAEARRMLAVVFGLPERAIVAKGKQMRDDIVRAINANRETDQTFTEIATQSVEEVLPDPVLDAIRKKTVEGLEEARRLRGITGGPETPPTLPPPGALPPGPGPAGPTVPPGGPGGPSGPQGQLGDLPPQPPGQAAGAVPPAGVEGAGPPPPVAPAAPAAAPAAPAAVPSAPQPRIADMPLPDRDQPVRIVGPRNDTPEVLDERHLIPEEDVMRRDYADDIPQIAADLNATIHITIPREASQGIGELADTTDDALRILGGPTGFEREALASHTSRLEGHAMTERGFVIAYEGPVGRASLVQRLGETKELEQTNEMMVSFESFGATPERRGEIAADIAERQKINKARKKADPNIKEDQLLAIPRASADDREDVMIRIWARRPGSEDAARIDEMGVKMAADDPIGIGEFKGEAMSRIYGGQGGPFHRPTPIEPDTLPRKVMKLSTGKVMELFKTAEGEASKAVSMTNKSLAKELDIKRDRAMRILKRLEELGELESSMVKGSRVFKLKQEVEEVAEAVAEAVPAPTPTLSLEVQGQDVTKALKHFAGLEGGMTASSFSRQAGVNNFKATKILDELVDRGVLNQPVEELNKAGKVKSRTYTMTEQGRVSAGVEPTPGAAQAAAKPRATLDAVPAPEGVESHLWQRVLTEIEDNGIIDVSRAKFVLQVSDQQATKLIDQLVEAGHLKDAGQEAFRLNINREPAEIRDLGESMTSMDLVDSIGHVGKTSKEIDQLLHVGEDVVDAELARLIDEGVVTTVPDGRFVAVLKTDTPPTASSPPGAPPPTSVPPATGAAGGAATPPSGAGGGAGGGKPPDGPTPPAPEGLPFEPDPVVRNAMTARFDDALRRRDQAGAERALDEMYQVAGAERVVRTNLGDVGISAGARAGSRSAYVAQTISTQRRRGMKLRVGVEQPGIFADHAVAEIAGEAIDDLLSGGEEPIMNTLETLQAMEDFGKGSRRSADELERLESFLEGIQIEREIIEDGEVVGTKFEAMTFGEFGDVLREARRGSRQKNLQRVDKMIDQADEAAKQAELQTDLAQRLTNEMREVDEMIQGAEEARRVVMDDLQSKRDALEETSWFRLTNNIGKTQTEFRKLLGVGQRNLPASVPIDELQRAIRDAAPLSKNQAVLEFRKIAKEFMDVHPSVEPLDVNLAIMSHVYQRSVEHAANSAGLAEGLDSTLRPWDIMVKKVDDLRKNPDYIQGDRHLLLDDPSLRAASEKYMQIMDDHYRVENALGLHMDVDPSRINPGYIPIRKKASAAASINELDDSFRQQLQRTPGDDRLPQKQLYQMHRTTNYYVFPVLDENLRPVYRDRTTGLGVSTNTPTPALEQIHERIFAATAADPQNLADERLLASFTRWKKAEALRRGEDPETWLPVPFKMSPYEAVEQKTQGRLLNELPPEIASELFETDLMVLLAQRTMEHERSVAIHSFRNSVLHSGQRMTDAQFNLLPKGTGGTRVIGGLEDNPVEVRKLDKKVLEESLLKLPGEDLENWVIPADLAGRIEDYLNPMRDPEQFGTLVRMIDTVHSWWKGATLLHPSWWTINMVGGMINSFVAGGSRPLMWPKLMGELAPILGTLYGHGIIPGSRADGIISKTAKIVVGGREWTHRELIEEAARRGIVSASRTLVEITNSVRAGGVIPNMKSLGESMKKQNTISRMYSGWFRFNSMTDDLWRLITWVDRMNQGDDPIIAAEKTIGALFDYHDLTSFEKTVGTRIWPFYRWMRNNIALQFKLLTDKPAWASSFPKLQNALEEAFVDEQKVPHELRPRWMKDQIAVQIAKDPNLKFIMLSSFTPVQELLEYGQATMGQDGLHGAMQYALGSTNPILKFAVETATDRDIFTGRDLGRADPKTGREPALETAGRYFRPFREATRTFKTIVEGDIKTAVIRALVGGRVQTKDMDNLEIGRSVMSRNRLKTIRSDMNRAHRRGDEEETGRLAALYIAENRILYNLGLYDSVPKYLKSHFVREDRERLPRRATGSG